MAKISLLYFAGPALLAAVTLAISAFTDSPKNSVSGGGIASGNIQFNLNALNDKDSKPGRISYGNVSASVECVAVSSTKKMATIYFSYSGSILGVTIVDGGEGKYASSDLISDPFVVDEMDCSAVIPQNAYNKVTSGNIHLK